MEEYLEIGKIVNTHGVKGEVKVIPLTDNPERFNDLEWVYIEKNNKLVKYKIGGVKFLKNFVIIKFQGVDDINSAQELKETYMKVDRKNAVKLPEGSFFICDLIGCTVFEENGNKLGVIADVIQTGSNDVYIVKREQGRDVLVPALKSVVRTVSLEKRMLEVQLPEGLVEDEV